MKIQLVIWILCLGLIGGLSASAKKAPPKKPTKTAPKDMVLKDCQKRKPPVAFPHELHEKKAKIACKKCHHKGKPDKKCSAVDCHAGKANSKRTGCAEMSLKKNPFHLSCRGCHKEAKQGPTRCAQCHRK